MGVGGSKSLEKMMDVVYEWPFAQSRALSSGCMRLLFGLFGFFSDLAQILDNDIEDLFHTSCRQNIMPKKCQQIYLNVF